MKYTEKPKTLKQLRVEIETGTTKATDLAKSYYERIERINPALNVYLHLSKDRAIEQAARVDAIAAQGDPLPAMAGIPVGIKDVMVVCGIPSTAGSRILKDYLPPYDATVVARLEAAGAVLLGKLNCDEFAMGSSNENSAYGPVRNPVDPEGQAVDQRRRLPPTWRWPRWAATRADPFGSQPASVVWWAFCPLGAAFRGMG
jgi:aspartyl-tRNA(Asn)/glutamyl-tRNA(Gln) amidotransferase subunit A